MTSIIIPTYNEADQIALTIKKVINANGSNPIEIIVADGGSTDETVCIAKQSGAITLVSDKKGRAAQMNAGAALAKGEILYFLHADTLPPSGFTADIQHAVGKGYQAGCFTLSFDHAHWFLKANCWFTRFDIDAVRFGDQSLFVTKAAFNKAGGFYVQHIVLEDQQIIKRLKKITSFIVIKKFVVTSARKYLENGIYKTQGIFFIIYFLYRLGFSQQKLVKTYKKLIRQNKL
ncbi:MAG TPA: TIGR04283 family arsenosugar biosynthesis glycosyltransferase [Mucilaginibacter sp.]|jgi:rSAM/selenodomain-associated transferase 2